MHGGHRFSAFHAQAYDATYLLLNAIKISSVECGTGSLVIGLQGMRDYPIGADGYEGNSGSLSLTPMGGCAFLSPLLYSKLIQEEKSVQS